MDDMSDPSYSSARDPMSLAVGVLVMLILLAAVTLGTHVYYTLDDEQKSGEPPNMLFLRKYARDFEHGDIGPSLVLGISLGVGAGMVSGSQLATAFSMPLLLLGTLMIHDEVGDNLNIVMLVIGASVGALIGAVPSAGPVRKVLVPLILGGASYWIQRFVMYKMHEDKLKDTEVMEHKILHYVLPVLVTAAAFALTMRPSSDTGYSSDLMMY